MIGFGRNNHAGNTPAARQAGNPDVSGARNQTGWMGSLALGAVLAATLLVAAGTGNATTGNAAAAPTADSAARVDVNNATAAELASLPGIGASKAAAIIAEREKKPFSSVDDLVRVRGIGERTVEDLRGKVSAGAH